jgi:hypothetical protein
MRNGIQFGCSNRSRQIIFLMVFVAVVLGPSASAQKKQPDAASAPKYDLHTEIKIKGSVEEVKLPPKGSEKEIVHLLVKEGANSLDVYLCPKSFFDDMGMSFSKGDDIAITGSKVKQGEAEIVLAREIVKGNDTFALRDPKGEPVWNWRH